MNGATDEVVQSIKGFDAKLCCSPNGESFQYELGKTYEHTGPVKACSSGFHAIEGYPLEVFGYYAPAGSRYAVVEQFGTLARHDGDSKLASSKIKIGVELSLAGLIKLAIEWTFKRALPIDPASPASATGVRGAASATGYQGAASATGDQGAASATGDQGAASATGVRGAASATGYQGAASATGYDGRAAGAEGNALFLLERDGDYNIIAVWAGIVGRDGIKPNVFYALRDGKPVEVQS